MKVFNPTENDISMKFKGVVYTAPAGGSANDVESEAATYWKTMIHHFVEISDDDYTVDAVEDVVEEKEESTIDATDTAVELAEEHDIDLSEVKGSGTDGRILKSDVEALITK